MGGSRRVCGTQETQRARRKNELAVVRETGRKICAREAQVREKSKRKRNDQEEDEKWERDRDGGKVGGREKQ